MKLNEVLSEMTLSVSREQTDEMLASAFEYITAHGKHIGDQDGFEVVLAKYKNSLIYGIKVEDQVVSIVNLSPTKNPNILELKVVHTLTPFRKKNHGKRLFWFVKEHEGKSFIDYGSATKEGIELMKSFGASGRFKMYWYNTQTREMKPYDDKADHFSNLPFRSAVVRTPWRILIECSEKSSFPRFHISEDFPFGNPYGVFE